MNHLPKLLADRELCYQVAMTHYTLITGASSGFGAAIARRFAREGKPLILLARRREKLFELREELSKSTEEIVVIVEDVRDREKIAAALKPYGEQVSTLVNNAGLALGLELAPEANFEDWETMVDTNIKGVLNVTHTLLPQMVKNNSGLIINIGSVAGTYPYPGGNVYGATKAFVKQFSLNLKAELLGTKVRVSNIEPAGAETEFSEVRFKGDSEKAKKVYQGWEPFIADDIAETVYWISSLPERVNINSLEIMGTEQAFGAFRYANKE